LSAGPPEGGAGLAVTSSDAWLMKASCRLLWALFGADFADAMTSGLPAIHHRALPVASTPLRDLVSRAHPKAGPARVPTKNPAARLLRTPVVSAEDAPSCLHCYVAVKDLILAARRLIWRQRAAECRASSAGCQATFLAFPAGCPHRRRRCIRRRGGGILEIDAAMSRTNCRPGRLAVLRPMGAGPAKITTRNNQPGSSNLDPRGTPASPAGRGRAGRGLDARGHLGSGAVGSRL